MLGFGVGGAALATLLSASISYLLVRFFSSRLIKTGINTRVFRHLVAAAIVCCLMILFQWHIYEITRFFEVFAICGSGGLTYMALLLFFREFTRKDLDFFIDTLDIRKMYGYVKGELFGNRD